jgi:hypothetical protein
MILPSVQARVKETRVFSGAGIDSRGVVRFIQIAVTATKGKIVIFVQPACGRWVDMLDFESDVERDLGRATIFAPVKCPLRDPGIA